MSAKNPPSANSATTVVANDPDDMKGALKNIGGSQSDHWNNLLANQALQALWIKNSDAETRDRQLSATVAAMVGIRPKDELEGMRKSFLPMAFRNVSHNRFPTKLRSCDLIVEMSRRLYSGKYMLPPTSAGILVPCSFTIKTRSRPLD
jgi:hypothetical protein